MEPSSKPIGPLPVDTVQHIYKKTGPAEGTAEHHQALEEKYGFGYHTLLGEMMYPYVTCRSDIGYAITTISKFSTTPSALHYVYLKHVARYLRATKHWGIRYKRSKLQDDLPPGKFDSIVPVANDANDLPEFLVDSNQAEMFLF